MPVNYLKYPDPSLDLRRKILPDQYPAMKSLYRKVKSYQKVAQQFGCSKKLAMIIIKPGYKELCEARAYAQKPWLKYYDKATHTKAIREFRRRKVALGLTAKASYSKKPIPKTPK